MLYGYEVVVVYARLRIWLRERNAVELLYPVQAYTSLFIGKKGYANRRDLHNRNSLRMTEWAYEEAREARGRQKIIF